MIEKKTKHPEKEAEYSFVGSLVYNIHKGKGYFLEIQFVVSLTMI